MRPQPPASVALATSRSGGELEGSILNPGLDLIWAGEADPATALPDLCQQIDEFLAGAGYPK